MISLGLTSPLRVWKAIVCDVHVAVRSSWAGHIVGLQLEAHSLGREGMCRC